ncbi:hypothetical protein LptCag_0284 [Leptospirillum ferriphilum]|uniref:Uncharacterized protein n=1 Tax=Leptospirillum ferriphilum TaxID=178606 RepID=A0A094W6Z1_9BACT|nr:hypothetical protein ABH19_09665 [Leptospirillum sp. Group II 'CF-1']KGA93248.1 hypothetical protein LptCag_0284 [Leptospirillum ferriphilum]
MKKRSERIPADGKLGEGSHRSLPVTVPFSVGGRAAFLARVVLSGHAESRRVSCFREKTSRSNPGI